MTLTTNTPTIPLSVTPTPTGTLASSSHTLTANTNVPTGYNLSLSTSTTPTLTPSTGSLSSPLTLANNSWGYAVPGTGGFDASYAVPVPSTTSKWANPSTTTTIKNTATAAANDPTTIYYGAKADLNLPSSTYANQVRYTATANTANLPIPTITSITPNSGTMMGGTQVTIVGTGFTLNDKSITRDVTIGTIFDYCENVQISSNTPTTGQDTITCQTPSHFGSEPADVHVDTWRSGASLPSSFTYTPPASTVTSPATNQVFAPGTTSVALNVTTEVPATCYYNYENYDYITMDTEDGINHSVTITGLTNNSTHNRSFYCAFWDMEETYSGAAVIFHVRAAVPYPSRPSNRDGLAVGATVKMNIQTSGGTCVWGMSEGSYLNASGADLIIAAGANTVYYRCIAGSGYTESDPGTGSIVYTGVPYAGLIQTVNTANCPTVMSYARDARDDATYLVKKLADNRCWMLTNLAYGGGGTNTYGDTKIINLNSTNTTFTSPEYYIPTGSNRTTSNTIPSISTTGTGQYGYLYNWCAAMGVQTTTSACAYNTTTPVPNTSISICPSGWRLPTGGAGGEFQQLTDAIGATTNGSNGGTAGSTVFRAIWLAMYGGIYGGVGFSYLGSAGFYWSSIQYNAEYSRYLSIGSSYVVPSSFDNRSAGFAVRCIAI